MDNLFRKFLYTGVGLVASTAEKVHTNINDTVEKTKNTQEEGEKVMTDLMKDSEAKFNEVEARLRSTLDSTLARFNLPNKEEFNALSSRIAELEAALAKKKQVLETTTAAVESTVIEPLKKVRRVPRKNVTEAE